jgi:hypothetical protein
MDFICALYKLNNSFPGYQEPFPAFKRNLIRLKKISSSTGNFVLNNRERTMGLRSLCDTVPYLGPHPRTPNPGFNPEFTPTFVI